MLKLSATRKVSTWCAPSPTYPLTTFPNVGKALRQLNSISGSFSGSDGRKVIPLESPVFDKLLLHVRVKFPKLLFALFSACHDNIGEVT